MINRERKIDINKLSDEQINDLQEKLSKKVSDIVNNAVNEANKYLNIYGLEARMILEIGMLGEFSKQTEKSQS